jgi:hypothetical protein
MFFVHGKSLNKLISVGVIWGCAVSGLVMAQESPQELTLEAPQESKGAAEMGPVQEPQPGPSPSPKPTMAPQDYFMEISGFKSFSELTDFKIKLSKLLPEESAIRDFKVQRGRVTYKVRAALSLQDLKDKASSITAPNHSILVVLTVQTPEEKS